MPKELVREELRRVTARIAARNTLFGMREEVLSLKEEAQKRLSTRSVRPVHAAARTVITMSLPSWRRTLTALLSFRARLRIVTVSAAARLYRAEKGEKPSRWEDLVPDYLPEVPGDPVKKKAKLQLTHRDGSLVIYSVGKDGEDNGGRGTLYEEEEDTPFGPVEPDRPDDMALSLW